MKPNLRSITGSRLLDLLTIFVVLVFLFPYLFMVSSAFQVAAGDFRLSADILGFYADAGAFRKYLQRHAHPVLHEEQHHHRGLQHFADDPHLHTGHLQLRPLPLPQQRGHRLRLPLLADGTGHLDRFRAILHRALAGSVRYAYLLDSGFICYGTCLMQFG